MQEVVTLTFCDIDYIEEGERVEGRRITWQINGKPWHLDVCQRHGLDITLVEIELFVEKYGHPEGAKAKPPKRAPADSSAPRERNRKGERSNKPAGAFEHDPVDDRWICMVPVDGGPCRHGLETENGLKLHQNRIHGLRITKK